MCNLVFFNILTELCSHHPYLIPGQFYHFKRRPCICIFLCIKPKQILSHEIILCLTYYRRWMLILSVLFHSFHYIKNNLAVTQYIHFMFHYWVVSSSLVSLVLDYGRSLCPTGHSTVFFPSHDLAHWPLLGEYLLALLRLYSGRAGSRSALFLTVYIPSTRCREVVGTQ